MALGAPVWFLGTRPALDHLGTAIRDVPPIHGVGFADLLEGSVNAKKFTSAIQSDNYVSGTAGWKITRSGTAEFNDVLVRGLIEASTYRSGPVGGQRVEIQANSATIDFYDFNGDYAGSLQPGASSLSLAGLIYASTAGGLGFFGVAPVGRPTVNGSRGANAALASLLSALDSEGLIVDGTIA